VAIPYHYRCRSRASRVTRARLRVCTANCANSCCDIWYVSGFPVYAKGHLPPVVGFGIAVIVGNTVGPGIRRTPGEIAAQLQNSGLVIAVWVLRASTSSSALSRLRNLGSCFRARGGWNSVIVELQCIH